MPPGDQDLEELLRLARLGEEEALGQLLQGFRPYLLRIANSEVPGGLQAKVGPSDVVQEALVEALKCFARFQGLTLAELQGWLRTILKRQVCQVTRHYEVTEKRQADREVPLTGLDSQETALAADQSSPSFRAGRQEEAVLVHAVLQQLPDHYRQILIWREWEELPFAEIAQRLGKSVDAARMVWWRALERFNEEMSKRG